MRRTLPLFKKKSPSSKQWLSRQGTDPFVKKRAEEMYASRSAYKLIEMDDTYGFLNCPGSIVDLGAAPGGWSQVVAARTGWGNSKIASATEFDPLNIEETADVPSEEEKEKIYAVDLLPIMPIRGVHIIQGNFLHPGTLSQLPKEVDVILSDMAGNKTGNRWADAQSGYDLVMAVYHFAMERLRRDTGVLVLKYFDTPQLADFRRQFLDEAFRSVRAAKPKASRRESSEAYWVCKGFMDVDKKSVLSRFGLKK